MAKGIEFIFTDGTKDWYDPVDLDTGFIDTGHSYVITVGAYEYLVEKDLVKAIRYYDVPEGGR